MTTIKSIKSIDFPNKTFASREELFAELKLNEQKIVSVKRAQIQKSFEKNCISALCLDKQMDTEKTIHMQEGFIYPVINTTKYMDSHSDVHLDGIWNRTVKEQQGKIFYMDSHKMDTASVIAWPTDVNMIVKTVAWSFLGKDYEGSTQALIFEINKANIENKTALEIINKKRPVQNSISMQYVHVRLAMNSDVKGDEAYKQFYDSLINDIANKEEAAAQGYFWGVSEAKIINEGSMVIKGSNPVTPIKEKSEMENDSFTDKSDKGDPLKDIRKFNYSHLL